MAVLDHDLLEDSVSAVKGLLNFIWDIFYCLTGEGGWSFLKHEAQVLEAATSSFDSEKKKMLSELLAKKFFVQRSNKRVGLPRFYDRLYNRLIQPLPTPDFDDNVINVRIAVQGREEIAQVVFYGGKLLSIQFKNDPDYYSHNDVQILGVRPGIPNVTHADAIDRMEHGKGR